VNHDKKQRLIQAAERLFRSNRFHEITLDEIAREANVGKGTIYLYFSDKEDLIFQAAVTGFDEMCTLLWQNVGEGVAFRDGLLRMCETISAFFKERRPLFRIIRSEGERAMESTGTRLSQRWQQRRKTMTEAVAAVIAKGVASGEIRGDIPPEILAEYLLGMLRTRSWELEDRPEPLRSHALMVDLFTKGARLRGPSGS
jgi:TetR/AcrR family fatty acid metabolism transcriptional regulator